MAIFERFRKKKTDSGEPGSKTEAPDDESLATNVSSPRLISARALGRSDSGSSTDNNPSLHSQLHLKASISSLNNHPGSTSSTILSTPIYNPFPSNNDHYKHILAPTSTPTTTEINYKVPLEDADDKIKVPLDTVERARSNTFNHYGQYPVHQHTLQQNFLTSGPLPSIHSVNLNSSALQPSTSAPTLTGSETADDSSGRGNAQVPRLNAATKPAAGTFATATVTSTSVNALGDFMRANTSPPPAPPLLQSTTLSASTESSATPSRSSSTSNRDGAGATGMSTAGSFTPISATPPMTPRLNYAGAGDAPNPNGQDIVHSEHHTSPGVRDRLLHQSQPQHMPPPPSTAGSTLAPVFYSAASASLMSSAAAPVSVSTMASPLASQTPFIPAEGDGITPAMAFVSSPISFQPPANPFSSFQASVQQQHEHQQQIPYLQDAFLNQYMPAISTGQSHSGLVITAAGGTSTIASSSSTTGVDVHRSNSANRHAVARDFELQQQQHYQEQQLAQFKEALDRSTSAGTMSSSSKESSTDTFKYQPPQPLVLPPISFAGKEPMPDDLETPPQPVNAAESLLSSSRNHQLNASSTEDDDHEQRLLRDRLMSAENQQDSTVGGSGSQQPKATLMDVVKLLATSTTTTTGSGSLGTHGGMTGGTGNMQPPAGHVHGHLGASGVYINGAGGGGGGSSFIPQPVTRASTAMAATHLITHDIRQSGESHIVDGSGPVVLMAIGKTGQGKSSLLNKIMGTSELRASASVRAVTKGIAERTGWGRFEDSRRVLVTLADTPGLADTEGDDEKNIPILKEYIRSVGTRLGVTAFLLVFKIDSGVDMIITILTTLNDIMKDFPVFWENVVLVFTGCDYRRNVMNTKQLYHEKIQEQLREHFFQGVYNTNGASVPPTLSSSSSSSSSSSCSSSGPAAAVLGPPPDVPIVFLSCAEAPCGFSLGEKCDCKARTTFLNAGLKRLWYAIRNKKRWVIDQDVDDGWQGHA